MPSYYAPPFLCISSKLDKWFGRLPFTFHPCQCTIRLLDVHALSWVLSSEKRAFPAAYSHIYYIAYGTLMQVFCIINFTKFLPCTDFPIHLRASVSEQSPAETHFLYCIQIKGVQDHPFLHPSCLLKHLPCLVGNKRRAVKHQA